MSIVENLKNKYTTQRKPVNILEYFLKILQSRYTYTESDTRGYFTWNQLFSI